MVGACDTSFSQVGGKYLPCLRTISQHRITCLLYGKIIFSNLIGFIPNAKDLLRLVAIIVFMQFTDVLFIILSNVDVIELMSAIDLLY